MRPPYGSVHVGAGGVRRGEHRQDRGDADAARDEQVAVRGRSGKWLRGPRTRTRDAGPRPRRARTPNRRGRPARAAPRSASRPGPPESPHSEYCRTRPGPSTRSMCAPGSQAGSVAAGGSAQVERDHAVGHGGTARHDQVEFGLRAHHGAPDAPVSRPAGWPGGVAAGWPSSHSHISTGSSALALGAAVADAAQQVGARHPVDPVDRGRRRAAGGPVTAALPTVPARPAGPGCAGRPARRCRC